MKKAKLSKKNLDQADSEDDPDQKDYFNDDAGPSGGKGKSGGKGTGKKAFTRKFCFTDGKTTCFGVEKGSLLEVLPKCAGPGTKVLLKNEPRIRRGLIMLKVENIDLVALFPSAAKLVS